MGKIIVNLDVVMAMRKMPSGELAEKVGITPANLSILKNNKAKANTNCAEAASKSLISSGFSISAF